MSVLNRAWSWLNEPAFQTRSLDSFTDHPGLTEQLLAVQGLTAYPWRQASIREALGVPAIFRAVTLISNTTGLLAVEALRDGTRLDPPPRIVQRPNPFTTPRDFFRDTAYSLATRGEAFWWVAARDFDGLALSLIPINTAEMKVDENPKDRRYPVYTWGTRVMPREDIVHITYLREPGSLRGQGPLQLCAAAVSVTVEAQHWAANFFAGDPSTTELKSLVDITEQEAKDLKAQWTESGASNLPRVTNPTVEWKDHQVDPKSAQMIEARAHQDGEAARMFGVPASLLDAQTAGSSLTYTNVEQEYIKFVRTCLSPNYLEPIEQALSDLLTRSTVARFNVEGLLRADIKTRFEVYEKAVAVFGPEEGATYARVKEGLEPGDIELVPVPQAQPQAIPGPIPQYRAEDTQLRAFSESVMALATREQPVPVVNIHPPSITVESPSTTYEAGAFQFTAPPAEVNITTPDVHVDVAAPDFSGLTDAMADLADRPAPTVNVAAPEVTVEPAQVTVNVPEQKPTRKKLKRDAANNITEIIEEPV